MLATAESVTGSASARPQTFLEVNSVSQKTLEKYEQNVTEFTAWWQAYGRRLSTVEEIDEAMVFFLDHLWWEGFHIGSATGFYAAWVKLNPQFGRRGHLRLPRTSKALQGWSRLDPGRTRPPLPLTFVALIVTELLNRLQLDAALATLLCFVAYLRPSELLKLQSVDLLPPAGGSRFHAIRSTCIQRRGGRSARSGCETRLCCWTPSTARTSAGFWPRTGTR